MIPAGLFYIVFISFYSHLIRIKASGDIGNRGKVRGGEKNGHEGENGLITYLKKYPSVRLTPVDIKISNTGKISSKGENFWIRFKIPNEFNEDLRRHLVNNSIPDFSHRIIRAVQTIVIAGIKETGRKKKITSAFFIKIQI